jgi:hypothetical protein
VKEILVFVSIIEQFPTPEILKDWKEEKMFAGLQAKTEQFGDVSG